VLLVGRELGNWGLINGCRLRDECKFLIVGCVDRRHIDTEAEEVFMLKNFSKVEEKGDGEEEVKRVDPIQWYGMLPSQTLKDAQERFVKGTCLGGVL
jgi:hypothetical protein